MIRPLLTGAVLLSMISCSGKDSDGPASGSGGSTSSGSGGTTSTESGGTTGTSGSTSTTGGSSMGGSGTANGGSSAAGSGNAGTTSTSGGAAGSGTTTGGSAGSGTTAGGGGKAATGGSAGAGTTGGSAGGGGKAATGGSAGTGTTGGSAGAATGGTGGATMSANSVLQRNNHLNRDGHYIQPSLTKATAAAVAKEAFDAKFSGKANQMWASPLYLENGPNGKGIFFAVTNGNDVYALDETTGAVVWTHSIGTPASKTGVSCGGISPLGVISTPVIDEASRTIYVAGAVGNDSGILRHEIHALSVDDGMEKTGWPVDASKVTLSGYTFNAKAQNQRAALSLVNGIVYVAYGGHVGDCDNYRGVVIGIDSKDPTKTGGWATSGKGEAIWAPGGLPSDGTSVFAVTGNNNDKSKSRNDSEQIVRISGLGQFTRDAKNYFYPDNWLLLDETDADFGGGNAVYVNVPGATPANYVVGTTKDAEMYFLDAANLGGMGAASSAFKPITGRQPYSGLVHAVPTVYRTAMGTYIAIATNQISAAAGGEEDKHTNCPGMMGRTPVVMGIRLVPGSPVKPEVAWCAPISGAIAAPISTTSDGMSNPLVWYVSGNKVVAVDGDTGASVATGGSGTCTGVRKWTSPIAVKGRIIVGGDSHLCSWKAP